MLSHPAYQARRSQSVFGSGLEKEHLEKESSEGQLCLSWYIWIFGLASHARSVSSTEAFFVGNHPTPLLIFWLPQPHHAKSEAIPTFLHPSSSPPLASTASIYLGTKNDSHTVPSITHKVRNVMTSSIKCNYIPSPSWKHIFHLFSPLKHLNIHYLLCLGWQFLFYIKQFEHLTHIYIKRVIFATSMELARL